MTAASRKQDKQTREARYFLFICGAFLTGALVGSLIVSCLPESGQGMLSSYYAAVAGGEMQTSLRSELLQSTLLIGIIFVSAMLRCGSTIIPAAAAVKGASISFRISCFIRAYGIKGYFPAVISIFIPALISSSAVILFSAKALEHSYMISCRGYGSRGRYEGFDRTFGFSAAAALFLSLAASVIYCCIGPIFAYIAFSAIS